MKIEKTIPNNSTTMQIQKSITIQCQPMQTDIFQMVIMPPKPYSTIKSS